MLFVYDMIIISKFFIAEEKGVPGLTLTSLLIAVAYITNIISIIAILFFDKKSVSSTLCWLAVFIFLPIVGFIFYFFLGSTIKFKWFSKMYSIDNLEKAYHEILDENIKFIEEGKMQYNDEQMEKYKDIVELNARNAESIYTQDNNVTLFTDANDQYAKMFQELENAKETINVLYFIIKTKDASGRKLLEILTRKAAQGVEVKLIYDILGYSRTSKRDFDPLRQAGGQVYGFMPSVIKSLLQANYRMHRKIVIIDGSIAYTGGINIGDDYLGKDPVVTPWRDTAVRLTGSCVQAAQFRFLSDWAYLEKQASKRKRNETDSPEKLIKYFKNPVETGSMGVQILADGPDKEYNTIKDSYIKMILSAKKYVYIQTPYLAPDETLLNALKIAAYSGVDVRIMIPGVPDKKFVYYVSLSYVEELLKYGIKIYKHKGFVHSKTFVLDDFVSSVGTANFDVRSFCLNFEMNTMIYSEDFALSCKNAYMKDIKICKEIKLEEYEKRGFRQRICESVGRLITPLV